MRILITGGAGFVGSHLADELLGARPPRPRPRRPLDRRDRQHPPPQGTTRASSTRSSSCHNAPVVAELVDSADVVYHLAAAVGVELIVESPVRTIETNVHATEVVLTAASKKKKPVFVASTSEVYGKSTALPFREDGDLVLGPTFKGRWSYACSKAIDEFLALAYWKERGLPTVIGRMFNTVGPRQTGPLRHGGARTSSRQALAGEPLTVFGDGTQSRCFCHVHDVVRALADLMERDDLYGEVFNIGSRGRDHDHAGWPRRSASSSARTPRSATSRTTRPTRRASRTCSGACRTSRRSARCSAGSRRKTLDEIVHDVRDHQLAQRGITAIAA